MAGSKKLNLKLDAYLCSKFPHLFAARGDAMTVTCMCWGFECGDGWYKIIRDAAKKLEPLIEKWLEENPGDPQGFPRAAQIKEKFGTMRFYLSGGTDEMYAITDAAERESAKICEQCGKPGKLRGCYWMYTACNKHTKPQDH